MAKRANAGVKFFLKAKKVAVIVVARKRKGSAKIKSAEVYIDRRGREVDLGRAQVRRFTLSGDEGERHAGYLLIIPYDKENGTTEPARDAEGPVVPTARVRVTITNNPPADDPEDVDIDETEQEPDDEPDDDPTGPFTFLEG